MSVAPLPFAKVAGRVGIPGLVLTGLAGVLYRNPSLLEQFAAVAVVVAELVFQVAAVGIFVIGLGILLYTHLQRRNGGMTEEALQRTSVGVLCVFVLSLGLPFVLLDDLALALLDVFENSNSDLPVQTFFLVGMGVFAVLTLVWLVDAFTRRVRTALR
jgi:hypothetical protein